MSRGRAVYSIPRGIWRSTKPFFKMEMGHTARLVGRQSGRHAGVGLANGRTHTYTQTHRIRCSIDAVSNDSVRRLNGRVPTADSSTTANDKASTDQSVRSVPRTLQTAVDLLHIPKRGADADRLIDVMDRSMLRCLGHGVLGGSLIPKPQKYTKNNRQRLYPNPPSLTIVQNT